MEVGDEEKRRRNYAGERKESLEILLCSIYEGSSHSRHYSFETESWTDTSVFSDAISGRTRQRYSAENLRQLDVEELGMVVSELQRAVLELSQRLVRQLKRRDHQLSRAQAKSNHVTAIIQALSPKRTGFAQQHKRTESCPSGVHDNNPPASLQPPDDAPLRPVRSANHCALPTSEPSSESSYKMSKILSSARRTAASSVAQGWNSVMKKCGVDAKLQFSLEPPSSESGFDQWLNAMKAVARLPDGIPHHFRRKLWLTLAQHHIQSIGLDWPDICRLAFSDRVTPGDEKLGLQIIKDLHRTGWSGLSGEQERSQLKRVLLAYARYNKAIGYCQGFNVIAALVLEVTEYKEENALKVMIFLIEHVLPNGYFDQTLRALSVDMAVLRDLLHQRLPRLAQHLDHLQKSSESEYEPPLINVFTMQWFLTMFATSLPKGTVFRVWDSMMLEGSEVLPRAALAIWSKIGRRVTKSKSADEFYGLMGPLCQELLQISPLESNDLIQVIYTMSEFPYPGLSELRERYTWNIQPFSSTFRLLRQQVASIINSDTDESADEKNTACLPGFIPAGEKLCSSSRGSESNGSSTDLGALQRQYKLLKQRQKQAAVILQHAYEQGQRRVVPSPRFPGSSAHNKQPCPAAFNHLYVGKNTEKINFMTLSGSVPVTSKVVQPGRGGAEAKRGRRRSGGSLSTMTPDISTERGGGKESEEILTSSNFSTPVPSPDHDDNVFSFQLRRSHSLSLPHFTDNAHSTTQRSRSADHLGKGRNCARLRTESSVTFSIESPCSSLSPHTPYAGLSGFIHESLCPYTNGKPVQKPDLLVYPPYSSRPPPLSHSKPGTQVESPMVEASKKKTQQLLGKSKAILNAIKPGVQAPPFNPFPTRHRTKLIEREKQMGLYH